MSRIKHKGQGNHGESGVTTALDHYVAQLVEAAGDDQRARDRVVSEVWRLESGRASVPYAQRITSDCRDVVSEGLDFELQDAAGRGDLDAVDEIMLAIENLTAIRYAVARAALVS